MDLVSIPIQELLPHDPPMVLLDRAVSFEESTFVAEVDIRADSIFCEDHGVPGWVGIEYMAQAVAAHAGYQARLEQEPPSIGYLLGTRSYRCSLPFFPIDATLRVHIESLYIDMGLGAFACRIEIDGTVAEATINVYQPSDGMSESFVSGKISQ